MPYLYTTVVYFLSYMYIIVISQQKYTSHVNSIQLSITCIVIYTILKTMQYKFKYIYCNIWNYTDYTIQVQLHVRYKYNEIIGSQ